MNDAKLGEFLCKLGVITPQQLHTAREMQAASEGQGGKIKLANVLVQMGFATDEELTRLAAMALRLPYVSLEQVKVPKRLIALLTREQARHSKGLIVKAEGKKFYLATFDPLNVQAIDELQFALGGRILPVVASERDVVRFIGHYYTERIVIDRAFDLPLSDSLDYSKPEVFDIIAERKKKAALSRARPEVALPADSKVKVERLAAAAREVAAKKPAQNAAPRVPAANVSPATGSIIRDAAELDGCDQPDSELNQGATEEPIFLLAESHDETDDVVIASAEGDNTNVDELLAMFMEVLLGGGETPHTAAPQMDSELSNLFLGALGGGADTAKTGPAAPTPLQELAQLLLQQTDFAA